MINATHEFTASSDVMRQAIDRHKQWIEAQMGIPVSEAVILKVDLCLTQAAIAPIVDCSNDGACDAELLKRLRTHLASVEIPPYSPPLIELRSDHSDESLSLSPSRGRSQYALVWSDLPVALHLHGMAAPIIAMNVRFSSLQSMVEDVERLVIVPRTSIAAVIKLLESLAVSDHIPRLRVGNSFPQRITPCSWDDLVLDPTIVDLLKNDFESFWEREEWFHERRLPFRRGYLLHGPPGCGKSTAIRAMMSSRSLSAHTLRLFDPNVDDGDLDKLFRSAINSRPSMILLEDLDRAFPRTGESKSKVSLQQLLNSLDGVASGEGIVVVATANEPTILDPAILRRPGRFDRVVCFPNPNSELRCQYFLKMNPDLNIDTLPDIVTESEGFSFALLREAYVIAGQHSFLNDKEITAEDLLAGVLALSKSFSEVSRRNGATGFTKNSARGLSIEGRSDHLR